MVAFNIGDIVFTSVVVLSEVANLELLGAMLDTFSVFVMLEEIVELVLAEMVA